MKKVMYFIIGLALLSSCEKEIEFKGEQTEPKLVINSLVEPGQPIMAKLSKSVFFLENHPNTTAPDDLVVSLYVNDNYIGEMTPHFDTIVSYDIWDPNDPSLGHVQKVYTYDYCPVVGDIVKITASASGYEDVEATTSPLPNALTCAITDTKINEWSSEYSMWYDELEDEEDSVLYVYMNMEMTIEITDPNPGQSDFFRIRFNRGSQYDDEVNFLSCYADYNDPVFGGLVADNDYFDVSDLDMAPEGVFTDVLFDGRSYQIKVPLYISLRKNDNADPDFFRIVFDVEHLSKEYYNYLNTCDQGEEYTTLYAELIQTYTNVKGGFGIVAGKNVNTFWQAIPMDTYGGTMKKS